MKPIVRQKTMNARTPLVVLASAVALVWMLYAGATVIAAFIPTLVTIDNPSPAANALFGLAVTGTGDLNADGVADLAVGAPGQDRVVVISGADQSTIRTLTDPDGLTGNRFGYGVAAIGDVNGDSVDDLAVGAPGPSPSPLLLPCPVSPCPPPSPAQGRAFIFSGASGAMLRKIVPTDEFIGFGVEVAPLGDVNGDGTPDVAVGMMAFGQTSVFGKVYGVSGATGATLWAREEPGGKQLGSMGMRLQRIADVNGDSRADLLAGAPLHDVNPDPAVILHAGETYVLSGATGTILRTHANPTPKDNDRYGMGLAAFADQNGDNIGDYAIGHPGAASVYLFSGANGSSLGTFTGGASSLFGFSMAGVADQNGDGRGDLWVSSPGTHRAHLLSMAGPGATLAEVLDPAPGPVDGGFGWRLAAAGDLGADPAPDVLVGNPAGNPNQSGKAFIILLTENTPPIADAGVDQTLECSSHDGALATLDASGSTDADNDALTFEWRNDSNGVVGATAIVQLLVPLGTHTFTVEVKDGKGGTDTDTVQITVADTTPPDLTVALSPSMLWPPNHKLVNVAAAIEVEDACDPAPSVTLLSIVSSEPDDGRGDGRTTMDVQQATLGSDDRAFQLRAERSGQSGERLYSVTYRAIDHAGNSRTVTSEVRVKH
jgi:K319L-like, PKD domain/FG-GAP repeat